MRAVGIVEGPSRVAIVEREAQSYVVGAGDRFDSVTVIAISRDKVVLKDDTQSFVLTLAPAAGFSLAAQGVVPAQGVPTAGPAEAISGQKTPSSPAVPRQPPGATSPAQPTARDGSSGASAPQASGDAATGTTPRSPSTSAPASPSLVAPRQPLTAPVLPPGATVFTPSLFVGTVGTVQYPAASPSEGTPSQPSSAATIQGQGAQGAAPAAPAGATAAPTPAGGASVTPSSPPSSQPPSPQPASSAPTQPIPTGPSVPATVGPSPSSGSAGTASGPSSADHPRFYEIKAGPVRERDRADLIARRLAQGGDAIGVSVNMVGSDGPVFVTTILIPYEKGALDRSLAIIRSVGPDMRVEVEPVPR